MVRAFQQKPVLDAKLLQPPRGAQAAGPGAYHQKIDITHAKKKEERPGK
jgi:hypothetical protein